MPIKYTENYPIEWPSLALEIKEANRWICQACNKRCRQPGEPFITHRRAWWYEGNDFGMAQALAALMTYLESDVATEPQGWHRADDVVPEQGFRIRRAHVEFGERVITVDGEEEE